MYCVGYVDMSGILLKIFWENSIVQKRLKYLMHQRACKEFINIYIFFLISYNLLKKIFAFDFLRDLSTYYTLQAVT